MERRAIVGTFIAVRASGRRGDRIPDPSLTSLIFRRHDYKLQATLTKIIYATVQKETLSFILVLNHD
jgi:hypothetical protein